LGDQVDAHAAPRPETCLVRGGALVRVRKGRRSRHESCQLVALEARTFRRLHGHRLEARSSDGSASPEASNCSLSSASLGKRACEKSSPTGCLARPPAAAEERSAVRATATLLRHAHATREAATWAPLSICSTRANVPGERATPRPATARRSEQLSPERATSSAAAGAREL